MSAPPDLAIFTVTFTVVFVSLMLSYRFVWWLAVRDTLARVARLRDGGGDGQGHVEADVEDG